MPLDLGKLVRISLCLLVLAALLAVGVAARLRWQDLRAMSASDPYLPPFKDPRNPDPFCRLWRYMDEGSYSHHLYQQGIILDSDQWDMTKP